MIDSETVRQEERAARDLDTLIERRIKEESAEGRPSPQALTDAQRKLRLGKEWKARRAAWYAYHLDQADTIERTASELAARHRQRAAALLEPEPRRVRT